MSFADISSVDPTPENVKSLTEIILKGSNGIRRYLTANVMAQAEEVNNAANAIARSLTRSVQGELRAINRLISSLPITQNVGQTPTTFPTAATTFIGDGQSDTVPSSPESYVPVGRQATGVGQADSVLPGNDSAGNNQGTTTDPVGNDDPGWPCGGPNPPNSDLPPYDPTCTSEGHWVQNPNPAACQMPIWIPPCPEGSDPCNDPSITCPEGYHKEVDPNDPTICICVPDRVIGDPDDPLCTTLPCCGDEGPPPLDPCCQPADDATIGITPSILWGVGNPLAPSDTPRKYHIYVGSTPHKMPPGRRIKGPAPWNIMRRDVLPRVLDNHDVAITGPCEPDQSICDKCHPPPGDGGCLDPSFECPPGYHLIVEPLNPNGCRCVPDTEPCDPKTYYCPPGKKAVADPDNPGKCKCIPIDDGGVDPIQPPPTVVTGCPEWTFVGLRPWDPGDPQLCANIESFISMLQEAGTYIVQGFDTVLAVFEQLDWLLEGLGRLPWIGSFFKWLRQWYQTPGNYSHDVICVWQSLLNSSLFPNSRATIALWFIKAVVKAFEQLIVGWELGPILIATIGVEAKQLVEILDYLIQYSAPTQVMTVGQVTDALKMQRITPAEAECYYRMNNTNTAAQKPYLDSTRPMASEDAVAALWFRDQFDDAQLQREFYQRGWENNDRVKQFMRSKQFIPTPSDAITLAIKDVFDPKKRGRDEMRDELEENVGLIELMRAAGIGKVDIADGKGGKTEYDLPLLYWMASYTDVSPTQSAEMLHRLRPNRVSRYEQVITNATEEEIGNIMPGASIRPNPNGPGVIVTPKPYSAFDHAKLLKEDDYNPIDRDTLMAISYRTITRVDLRRIYFLAGFGQPLGLAGWDRSDPLDPKPIGVAEKEVTEYYRDEGYAEKDARLLSLFASKDYELSVLQPERTKAVSKICKAYQLGLYDETTFQRLITPLLKYPESAPTYVQNCKADITLKIVTEATAAVRSQFLKGVTGAEGATEQLTAVGVLPGKISELLTLWNIQRAARSKEVQANKLCKWLEQKLITVADFRGRLANLGYKDSDIIRIIKSCETDIGKRAEAAAIKAEKERLAAEEKQRRADLAAAKQKAAADARGFTETLVKKSWAAGIIDERQAADILKTMQWDDDAISLWLKANRTEK